MGCSRLESECAVVPYRGFESLSPPPKKYLFLIDGPKSLTVEFMLLCNYEKNIPNS